MKALYLLLFVQFSYSVLCAQQSREAASTEKPGRLNMVQSFPEEEQLSAEREKTVSPLGSTNKRVAETARGLIYFTDFRDNAPGTAPLAWFSSEEGLLQAVDGHPGLWLSLAKKASYAPARKFTLPAAFTLQFDLLLLSPAEEGLGTFSFALAAIEDPNPTEAWRYPHTMAHLYVGWNYSAFTVEQAGREEKHYRKHNILRQEVGRPVRVSIRVADSRYTLRVNGQKIMDIPRLLEEEPAYNSLLLQSQLSRVDKDHQVLISNIQLQALTE